jgi:hypothetical protein
MALDRYHLTKRNNEWRLEKAGSDRALLKAPTKAEAVQKMRRFMKTREGSVRIHKVDGKIQEERTYPRAKDPRSSKG